MLPLPAGFPCGLWPFRHPRSDVRSKPAKIVLVIVAVASVLFTGVPDRAMSQVTESVFASLPGGSTGDLIQASDGNFYGTTYAGGTTNSGTVFQVTPIGVLTVLHSFNSSSDGGGPQSGVIQGTDGNLYGATSGGGSAGGGTLFKMTLTGQFTLLHAFSGNLAGANPQGALVQGIDGNFYGVTQNGGYTSPTGNPEPVFFRVDSSGNYTTLLDFGTTPGYYISVIAASPSTLLQGSDGNFYGTSRLGGINNGQGSIFSVTPGGSPALVYSFTGNADGGHPTFTPLVEGPDGSFYGTAPFDNASQGGGVVFQYSPAPNLAQVHGFNAIATGEESAGGVFWGSDGALYGTTILGGSPLCANGRTTGCGTFYKVNPDGTNFQSLYSFQTAPDASVPNNGAPMQASDGSFYGVTTLGGASNTGGIYKVTLSPALPAPVLLTLSSAMTPLNQPVTLNWEVFNAFSLSAQQCFASVQGSPLGAGNWTGVQAGTLRGVNGQKVFEGSATITPTANGVFTYALTCGGRESGFVTLTAGTPFQIVSPLSQGVVGEKYLDYPVTGGTQPYTLAVLSGNLPPGLALIPAAGNSQVAAIGGTPTQFGIYSFVLQGADSAAVPAKISQSVSITILSGLAITGMINKGTVGADFKQTLVATGGTPPYSWSITAGSLPDGLTLNSVTGLISGKPTKVGVQTVTLQVQDSEKVPAQVNLTQPFTIEASQPIAAVEFTQAIQQYQTLTDLKASLTATGEPPVPIIAGKPMAMRIYYTAPDELTTYSLTVTGAVSDSESLLLVPNCTPVDQRAKTSPCLTTDLSFTPPATSFSVTLTLTDNQGKQVEQETLLVNTHTTQGLTFRAVEVCTSVSCGQVDALLPSAYLNSIMPASTTYEFHGSTFNFSGGVPAELLASATFYTPAEQAADLSSNQRSIVMGVRGQLSEDFDTQSIDATHGVSAVGVPDQRIYFGVEVAGQILGTAVGASLGLQGTGLYGHDLSVPGCFPGTYQGGYWPFPTNNVQSSQGLEYGYDVTGYSVKDPNVTYDTMSYCFPTWISPIQYKRLITALGGGAVSSPSVSVPSPAESAPAPRSKVMSHPTASSALTPGTYLQVSGGISNANVSLNPIFTETMSGSTDAGTGSYSIVEQSTSGQALYTRHFALANVSETTGDPTTGQTTVQEPSAFSEWIPQTAGTASIGVFDPTGNLLSSVALTGSSPTVAIASPAAGFVGSGQQTVSWTSQEQGVTSFFARIFYSIDSGMTWIETGNSQTNSATIDFSHLPGGNTALIRVDVSDGINTGTATSAPFLVPRKLPTSVLINTPATGSLRLGSRPVYLTGGAFDPDDGALTGSQLQWSSNIQGALGSGSLLPVKLQPGTHTLTLTATDSDGNAISTTTTVTVVGGPPTVSIGQAPCSPNASINAAPSAQGANLTSVQYSLDGGITYANIPTGQLPYALNLAGVTASTLLVVAVEASGQVGAQSLAIIGSGCATYTLTALTGSGQSATVGTAFTTPLKVLVKDGGGNLAAGVSLTFNPPSSGASALLSSASATTGSDGTASVSAVANGVAGSYNVAAALNGSVSATFALTNVAAIPPSFTIAAASKTLSIAAGGSATDSITLTASGGFSSAVAFACTGLPAGATCAFSPATLTPPASTASVLTVYLPKTAASLRDTSSGEVATALGCLGVLWLTRRKKFLSLLPRLVLLLVIVTAIGCENAPAPVVSAPTSFTLTVTGSSGSLQHNLMIQVN